MSTSPVPWSTLAIGGRCVRCLAQLPARFEHTPEACEAAAVAVAAELRRDAPPLGLEFTFEVPGRWITYAPRVVLPESRFRGAIRRRILERELGEAVPEVVPVRDTLEDVIRDGFGLGVGFYDDPPPGVDAARTLRELEGVSTPTPAASTREAGAEASSRLLWELAHDPELPELPDGHAGTRVPGCRTGGRVVGLSSCMRCGGKGRIELRRGRFAGGFLRCLDCNGPGRVRYVERRI